MRSSCISYPENDPVIIVSRNGNYCELIEKEKSNPNLILLSSELFDKYGINVSILLFVLSNNEKKSISQMVNESLFLSYSKVKFAIYKAIDFNVIERTFISDEVAFSTLKLGKFDKGCEFCGHDKSFLDKHHYPIRARDGGKGTINICSNCHREFHQITDYGLFSIKGGVI